MNTAKKCIRNENAVVLTNVKMSFAHLFQKDTYGGKDEYNATFLIPKDDKDAVNALKKAIESAKEMGNKNIWKGKMPDNLYVPIHDGDTQKDTTKYPEYKNCYYLLAKSKKNPPKVFDVKHGHIPLTEEDMGSVIYSGMVCAPSISFHPYTFSGQSGIRCQLEAVMKTGDGEHFGGGARIDFDDVYSEWYKEAGTDNLRPDAQAPETEEEADDDLDFMNGSEDDELPF